MLEKELLPVRTTWKHLLGIPYDFKAGPLEDQELAMSGGRVRSANCQRAVQLWYADHGIFLYPEHVLSQESFYSGGALIQDSPHGRYLTKENLKDLPYGAVIFSSSNRGYRRNDNGYSWEQLLHMSVYVGQAHRLPSQLLNGFDGSITDHLVFHATPWMKAGGQIALWTLDQLYKYYTPIRVRHLAPVKTYRQ